MSAIDIKALNASPDIREALSEILVEAVASGGSVSFMHPLALEVADTFWEGSLAAAARGGFLVAAGVQNQFVAVSDNGLVVGRGQRCKQQWHQEQRPQGGQVG